MRISGWPLFFSRKPLWKRSSADFLPPRCRSSSCLEYFPEWPAVALNCRLAAACANRLLIARPDCGLYPSSRGNMRVLVLHNIISPHVLPYFEGLAAEPDVDLTVWFLDRSTSARNWDTTVRGQFRWEILPGFRLEIPLEERVVLHINPSILWRIPKGKFAVVVLFAGYDSPTLWLAALICRMLRIPLVVRSGSLPGASAFGATSSRLARLRRSATRFLVRAVVRSAQTWVAYGSRSKRYLIELGASADRVYTCWNTVRTQELANQATDMRTRRDAIREERGVSQENVVFLYVGRLEAFKRVEILIDAFKCLRARMPQIILWIV